MIDPKNPRDSFFDLCYVCRQRHPAGGRGALRVVVSDAVDGRARYGLPEPGGLEDGAGALKGKAFRRGAIISG